MIDISKINNVGTTQNVKKKNSSVQGNFSDFLDVPEHSEVKQNLATNNLSALNFLNEVDENEERKKKKQQAITHGTDILEELEKIRIGLLMGGMTQDQLIRVQKKLEGYKQDFIDPKLDFIINEIEVRAAVELAKFGVF